MPATRPWVCPPRKLPCWRCAPSRFWLNETGVANTVDPVAGSYLIEHLTGEVERGAREYLERIDAMGGTLHAIETGYIQREIQAAAYQYQKAVESGEQVSRGREPVPHRHAEAHPCAADGVPNWKAHRWSACATCAPLETRPLRRLPSRHWNAPRPPPAT